MFRGVIKESVSKQKAWPAQCLAHVEFLITDPPLRSWQLECVGSNHLYSLDSRPGGRPYLETGGNLDSEILWHQNVHLAPKVAFVGWADIPSRKVSC